MHTKLDIDSKWFIENYPARGLNCSAADVLFEINNIVKAIVSEGIGRMIRIEKIKANLEL